MIYEDVTPRSRDFSTMRTQIKCMKPEGCLSMFFRFWKDGKCPAISA